MADREKQGGRPRLVDLAFSTLGDDRDCGGITHSNAYQAYAASLIRGGGGVAPGTVLTAPGTSRATTAVHDYFEQHPGLRLRNLYFVGHGRAEGDAFNGQAVPLLSDPFRAPDHMRALSPSVPGASATFWRAVRGQLLLSDRDVGPHAHTIEFRACALGRGPLVTGLVPFLGSQLRGQIYSVQGDYEFRPVFAARGGRLLYVEARVQGGSFVRPPVRPSGITTPYGGGP